MLRSKVKIGEDNDIARGLAMSNSDGHMTLISVFSERTLPPSVANILRVYKYDRQVIEDSKSS